MGAYCAKLCLLELPNPRRNPRRFTHARVDSVLSRCDCVRLQSLRDSSAVIFKAGFTLGLQVRKLQAILEALDAGDERRTQRPTPEVSVQDSESPDLSPDEALPAVPPDSDVSEKIEDQHTELVRKREPHSLTDLIKEDFKPWLRVSHHPGCRASLP